MRKEELFNDNWEFIKLPYRTEYDAAINAEGWEKVALPHDWLIFNTKDLYGDASGWYRKHFNIDREKEKIYLINFDGVYMDSSIYINGTYVGSNHYGYSSFEFDITSFLVNGDNEIAVGVQHKSPNTRWYSGAGIFRDVTFKTVSRAHIATNGVYIHADHTADGWRVKADIETVNIPENAKVQIDHEIKLIPAGEENSYCICRPCAEAIGFVPEGIPDGDRMALNAPVNMKGLSTDPAAEAGVYTSVFTVENPVIWDITSPNLYELKTVLTVDGNKADEVTDRFGLREIEFTVNDGFKLNGRRVKINGVCEHHDLGALGAAFYKDAFRRKIYKLKSMGVNAIRTSHNMPAKGLVELADEMGMLLDSEAFDMWRRPKTEYDYARFFEEDHAKDIASWVRRDRNSPSVIMWSIGNEIYDCHADESAVELTRELMECVKKYDYMGNAHPTFGCNYMPWEGGQKCADVLKLAGYNYGERLYDEHHKKYPDWMIYGSETCSTVQSRGIYHFPMKVSVMSDDDEQCSALGNSTTSWGAPNVEYVIKADRDRKFSAGQFLWSGFDYIGEPTPYHTKNSYFGQIDTAGFFKDTYYIFKAEWTDVKKAPFVHLFPYWDFNEGQIIDVRIASNAPCVELIVNGASAGKKEIDHEKGEILCPVWQIPYHEGYIEAVAYDENGKELTRDRRTSFDEAETIKYERTVINDLIFYELSAVDKNGNVVENANRRINITVENGILLGMDNGDSTDFDEYKTNSRRMFAGKLLAIVKVEKGKSVDDVIIKSQFDNNDIPIRKIEIIRNENDNKLNRELKNIRAGYLIKPENATFNDVTACAVNDLGVEIKLADVTMPDESGAKTVDGKKVSGYLDVAAKGDGCFRLRCMTHNGTEKMQCISSIEFESEGIGTAYMDPYDFITGSLYTDSKGDVGNGNEKGAATPRGVSSYIGYNNLDFGEFGSDEITLPIFTLDDNEYRIGIWKGRPYEEGSRLLLDAVYCKPSIWNVYQPETYKLPERVKGITDIYFTASDKFHIKGFSFTKPDKAFATVYATENSRIYGDTFTVTDEAVTGIGNNVTIEFDDMVFDGRRAKKLIICGRAVHSDNSVHLKISDAAGNADTSLMEFKRSEIYTEQEFEVPDTGKAVKVAFVFLPGSNFDMKYFRFE
ncbi:MAG: DUF4982 domain-containing protein [Lachnospiraceae bacterium]|nr:DUF4982 domain-containing protein [Lachnospiraceae bacterium]